MTLNTPSPTTADTREITCLTVMNAQGWTRPLDAEELLTGSLKSTHPGACVYIECGRLPLTDFVDLRRVTQPLHAPASSSVHWNRNNTSPSLGVVERIKLADELHRTVPDTR